MPSKEHEELCALGARWCKRNGFSIIATNIQSTGSQEKPDVIAFRSDCSLLIEAKVSRGDFFADRNKTSRNASEGLGLYRFYIAPHGMISPDELPVGWGLLEKEGRSIKVKVGPMISPKDNLWPSEGISNLQSSSHARRWMSFQHPIDYRKERAMLFAISRKLSKGDSILR